MMQLKKNLLNMKIIGITQSRSLVSRIPKGCENLGAYGMNKQLKDQFQELARTERFKVIQTILRCKKQENGSLSSHVLKIKGCFDIIECFGFPITQGLAIDCIHNSLTSAYKEFNMSYYMNGFEKSIIELHGKLKIGKEIIVPPRTSSSTTSVLAIREGSVKRKSSSHPNDNGKWEGEFGAPNSNPKKDFSDIPPLNKPNYAICYYYQEKVH